MGGFWRSVRRPLQIVHRHRLGQGIDVVGHIHADRKPDPELAKEGLKRDRRLGLVMLENTVQANDRDVLAAKRPEHPGGLRQAVEDAPRAEHLEGFDHHHAPAQAFEGDRLRRVKPLADHKLWRGSGRAHQFLT